MQKPQRKLSNLYEVLLCPRILASDTYTNLLRFPSPRLSAQSSSAGVYDLLFLWNVSHTLDWCAALASRVAKCIALSSGKRLADNHFTLPVSAEEISNKPTAYTELNEKQMKLLE